MIPLLTTQLVISRRLIIGEDIFMANLVLQLSPLNLKQTKPEKHLHSIHKKGPIITYLIEPCYLFTVVAKLLAKMSLLPCLGMSS